jgi:hypothetical protein
MKRFLSISVLAVSLTLVFVFAPERSLTASNPAIGPVKPPIKVLAVRLDATKATTMPLENLEVQIENTSGKPIQYLVIHAEIAVGANEPIRVPMVYGQAFQSDSNSEKMKPLQPGSTVNLRAARNICERARKQLAASGIVVTEKQVQPNVHLVIFQDRTAWLAGRLHVPDPANPKQWIATEEMARLESPLSEFSFSKVSYKPAQPRQQQCYRYTGFNIQFCCSDDTGDYRVGNAHFTEDPTGNVHPNTVVTCCPQDPTACCSYDEIAGGCL